MTQLNTTLTVTATGNPSGVLGRFCVAQNNCTPAGADRSSDNPTLYVGKQAVFVNGSGPFIINTTTPSGTLAFNGDGGFIFTPAPSFTGYVTFKYKANDGSWAVDSSVPMNGKDALGNELFTADVTVTIHVQEAKGGKKK